MSVNIDELKELHYAPHDPQLYDEDAVFESEKDEWLDDIREVYDGLDNVTSDISKILDRHENKNVRSALGAINRAMEYLYREL